MMPDNNRFSQNIIVFHERCAPEEGTIVGYAALINFFKMEVPLPDRLALISQKHKQYETDEWIVFTPRHQPEESLMGHLTFALKYEGIDLGILKKVFTSVVPSDIEAIISLEPTGQYSKRIWFLYGG